MDLLPDGKIHSIVTHPQNDSYANLPTIGSNLPLPLLTPPLVSSPLRTQGFSLSNEFTSRFTGAQFHSGHNPVDSVTSTLTSMYRTGAAFLESPSSNNSFKFHQREPAIATNLSAPEVFGSTHSRSFLDGITRQTESTKIHSYIEMNMIHPSRVVSCTETYVAPQGSVVGYPNYDPPSQLNSHSMTSCLRSAEKYKMRKVNEYSDSSDRSLVQDLKESGLLKTNSNDQYTYIADVRSTRKDTTKQSAVNRGKSDLGSENVKTSISDNNDRRQLNNRDKEQNQKVPNDLLTSVGYSDYRKISRTDEKSKSASHIMEFCETNDVEDTSNSKHDFQNCSLGSRNSVVDLSDSLSPRDPDEQTKSFAGKMFSVSTEKLWDGSLQLNTSTTVAAVAFFKSGEKVHDIRWSDLVEVKGKVKLQAFEKFIQELPRSRTRALMVISLCWKAGSSLSGLEGMKEVANGYKESERVGFAQICPGIDLYVCPRSDTIITILAKFGFFKGMAAVEEDPNSLIGCIVWRRSGQSLNSNRKPSDRIVNSLVQHQLHSSKEITDSSLSQKQDEHSKQALLDTRETNGVSCQKLLETKSTNGNIAGHTGTESKLIESNEKSSSECSSKSSTLHGTSSLPYNSPIAPVQRYSPQKVEIRSKECLKSSLLHAAETNVVGSEPARLIPLQSTQMLPESHQGNIASIESSSNLSSCSNHFMQSDPPKPFGSFPVQQTVQRSYSCSQDNPAASVSKAESYMMHFKESATPAMSCKLSQTTLPGPPPLPPDVLERLIQSQAAISKVTSVGIINAELPAEHVCEPKKSSIVTEPNPVLPGQPPLLPPGLPPPLPPGLHPPLPPGPHPSLTKTAKVSASLVDVDDLPEFDFSSTCEVPRTTANIHPWSRPVPDVPLFNKQLPSDLGKSLKPLGSSMQSIEVIQRQHFSSFLGDSLKNYQGIPSATNFEKPIPDTVIRNTQSHEQPCIDARKCSVGPILNSSYPRKRRWDDDDDDMPEWCPPDTECVEQIRNITAINLPSPVYTRNPEFARHHPFVPPPSSSSLCSPRSPGLPHGYQHEVRGPPTLSHNPNPPVQIRAAAGFDHCIQKSPLVQNPTNFSRYRTSTRNKRPLDVPSRYQRP
ncbi:hypothetical protein Cni_G25944 [Canna indica]|uniref:Spen paralogue and orthologue SPOC C-terminal domain-containing protein n=1 Tax=Canna indica TaxID=4628 RepID=A0AAQ3KYY6_9LILI|nr:hypothetical protein Cni_G25944 [Canna indica]